MASASPYVSVPVRESDIPLTIALENYLQLSPDDPVRPGALGLGQGKAVLIIYVWFIYSYSTPLAGGLLADCWLGRRKSIQVGFLYVPPQVRLGLYRSKLME